MTAVFLRLVVLWTSGAITAVGTIAALRRHIRRNAALERISILFEDGVAFSGDVG